MPTVREVTVALLRELGLTTVFGNPGSTELPMLRDFPGDFDYVLGLQESVALSMADGFAQARHHAAVVSLHSAAGVGHAMGGLFTAYRNRTPLVVLAGQQSRSLLAGEPYLFSDQAAELPRPYVKWSREPASARDVPAAIARGYYLAMTPPRGPVLVSVPADDWERDADPVVARSVSTTLGADAAGLAAAGRMLVAADRPAFVVGAAVDQEQAHDEVVALAELHNARVWAQPMSSRCAFPERHPLFAGFLPPNREGIVETLTGHDVVLVLGAPVFTYHVAGSGPHVPDGTTLIQLTDDPHTAAWTPVGTAVLTGIRSAARALLDHRPPRPRPAPPHRAAVARVRASATISTPFLMQTLAETRPASARIVEEAPSSRPVMCEHLPNEGPSTFFTTASGALGYALPAAVGMALSRPPGPVIAVLGDGSMMYSIQALWTAADRRLPLTVVVVNNHGYATVDRFAQRFGLKPVGTVLSGLDFAGLARAQGCDAARVEHPADLVAALRTAFACDGPYLVEVLVDD